MKKQNKTLATVPGQQTTCRPSGRLRRTCERRCYYVLQVLPLVPRDSLFVFVLLHHLSQLAMRRMLPSRNCSKMSRRLLNSNAQQQLRRTSPRKGSLIDKDRWSLFSSMELVALALTKENEFARAQSSAFCLLLRDFDHPYSKCFFATCDWW